MYETVFILWMIFDAGSNGGIQVKTIPNFITQQECDDHAKTVKTLMLQPKYARYVCAPMRVMR